MSTIGSLDEFSLPELLQFIEKGHKTGLLTIQAGSVSQASQSSVYYIWVYQGRIVAAAKRLDGQGLVKLIEQRQWVSKRVLNKLIDWCCPPNEPLGQSLNNQGILRIEQLKELFYFQVLQPVLRLFKLKDGVFKFDQDASLPMREMTGLSVSAGLLKHYILTPDKLAIQTKLFKDGGKLQIKSNEDTIKRLFIYLYIVGALQFKLPAQVNALLCMSERL